MLTILEKIAIAYSLVTLFVIELLYQTILAVIKGTQYSLKTLKNTLIDQRHSVFFKNFEKYTD